MNRFLSVTKAVCLACSFLLTILPVTGQEKAPTLSAGKTQPCYTETDRPKLFIHAGSGKTSYVSAVLNDPTDPAATDGILFSVTNNPSSFIINSSNKAVVPESNITMKQVEGDNYVLKIIPAGVGYSTITVKASNGKTSSEYKIEYAASAAASKPAITVFPTGISDASAAIALNDDYMFAGDDETNSLRLYNRKTSGQALYKIDISNDAGGVGDEEFDIEGATLSSPAYNNGQRIYWIGSMGNGKNAGDKPYRNRVIATDISGSGASATLKVNSYSTEMRKALIAWGDANSWDFSTSTEKNPKRIDGFNVEAITIAHEGETAYIGMRAPYVPLKGEKPSASNRKYAIIAPVTNFESMMNQPGKSTVKPILSEPILFDLNGLGIRDMVRIKNRGYLIIAGLYKGGGTPELYLWDGTTPKEPGTHPISLTSGSLSKLTLDLSDLVQQAGGVPEGFPEAVLCEEKNDTLYIHLICDSGTVDFYQDGTNAKSLTHEEFKKFRMANYIFPLNRDKR